MNLVYACNFKLQRVTVGFNPSMTSTHTSELDIRPVPSVMKEAFFTRLQRLVTVDFSVMTILLTYLLTYWAHSMGP